MTALAVVFAGSGGGVDQHRWIVGGGTDRIASAGPVSLRSIGPVFGIGAGELAFLVVGLVVALAAIRALVRPRSGRR